MPPIAIRILDFVEIALSNGLKLLTNDLDLDLRKNFQADSIQNRLDGCRPNLETSSCIPRKFFANWSDATTLNDWGLEISEKYKLYLRIETHIHSDDVEFSSNAWNLKSYCLFLFSSFLVKPDPDHPKWF